MTRYLLVIVAFLLTIPSISAQSSSEVMERLSSGLASMESVSARYSFRMEESSGKVVFSTDGEFYSKGDRFLVRNGYSDIYCDGRSKYIYDKGADEVIIIGHNPKDSNMSENPFIVLKTAATEYRYPSRPNVTRVSGDDCFLITLTPKNDRADHVSVELAIRKSDYCVRMITYRTRKGEIYRAEIESIADGGPVESSFFELDIDSLPDVFVSDLR